MIHVPKKSLLLLRRGIEMPRGHVAGRFKIEAVRLDGTKRLLADWFPNLILDAGLNRWGTGAIITACQVGTGSATPTESDTQLQSRVAGTSTIQASNLGAQGSAPYYGYQQRTFRFGAGAAAGNLAEVGVGWATSGAALWSRALILDGEGDPTTITVLGDEFLDVTYELRTYPPTVDGEFNITISGVEYTCVMRAASVTNGNMWASEIAAAVGSSPRHSTAYNGAIGAITSSPSGTSSSTPLTGVAAAYSNNSLQRDITIAFDLNTGNLAGGISAIGFSGGMGVANEVLGRYQCSFSPAIPKDNTKTLSLEYRVEWARKTLTP